MAYNTTPYKQRLLSMPQVHSTDLDGKTFRALARLQALLKNQTLITYIASQL